MTTEWKRILDLQNALSCGVEETTYNVLDTAETWDSCTQTDLLSDASYCRPCLLWTQEELATRVLPVKVKILGCSSRGHTLTPRPGHRFKGLRLRKVFLNNCCRIRHLLFRHPPHKDTLHLSPKTIHLSLKTTLHIPQRLLHSTRAMRFQINNSLRKHKARPVFRVSSRRGQRPTSRVHYSA
ncbi:hypothetical protein BD311DRAFT_751471 [Dichomitus squalens]|uniref:Uncharacterized protein n=1 Tax=Dichomitus squalens TaxID=114155 RepID=A0A4Q9MXT3_9APHY|nr:hypothetical protein BD311DRAFT_751471 [Dichomitus squalens]